MDLRVRGNKTYAATGGKEFDKGLDTVLFVHGSGLDPPHLHLTWQMWGIRGHWYYTPALLPIHACHRKT